MSDLQTTGTMDAFYEKLSAKIRDDIASIIPDEAIRQLAEKVISDEFFEKREIKNDWGKIKSLEPTRFQSMILEATEKQIQAELKRVLSEKNELIEEIIKEAVNKGLEKLMFSGFTSMLESALLSDNFLYDLKYRLSQP